MDYFFQKIGPYSEVEVYNLWTHYYSSLIPSLKAWSLVSLLLRDCAVSGFIHFVLSDCAAGDKGIVQSSSVVYFLLSSLLAKSFLKKYEGIVHIISSL